MPRDILARSLAKNLGRIAATLVVALAGADVARADDASPGALPPGEWVASVANPDTHRPIAVTLEVGNAPLGQPNGNLHFGAPRACQLDTEYSGLDGAAYYLAFTRSTGGYCDRLLDGGISLEAKGSGLDFVTLNKKGGAVEHGTFARQAAAH